MYRVQTGGGLFFIPPSPFLFLLVRDGVHVHGPLWGLQKSGIFREAEDDFYDPAYFWLSG